MPRGAISWFAMGHLEHTGPRFTPAISPDGKVLAALASTQSHEPPADFDDTIRFFDLLSRKRIHTLSLPKARSPSCLRFGSDGRRVAYSLMLDFSSDEPDPSDGDVFVYDLKAGKKVHQLKGHDSEVMAIDFSPDGRLLATGDEEAKIRIWDLATGRNVQTLQPNEEIRLCALAFSPDGRQLAVGGDHSDNSLWDVKTGKNLGTFGEPACLTLGLSFSPDGQLLAASNQSNLVIVTDPNTRKPKSRLMHTGIVGDVAYSPSGRLLAAGGGTHYGQVVLWSADGAEKRKRFRGHTDTVLAVRFWPDGRRLSSASQGELIVWDLQKLLPDQQKD
ncbi:MAG: WD40 repeat domain-containing protein [Phycisphaeraceae bacterium]|nr:WD40 repeat domain-containing protein [Phycisphaeraceae bacterium]